MERLTARNNFVLDNAINAYEHTADSALDRATLDFLKELREYRKSEEQGLLLRLPCKEGSTVYVIKSRYTECTREQQEFDEYSCQGCEWLDCDSHKEYYIHTNKSVTLEWILRYSKDIGKTVFLATEEAEQALKRMESE